MQGLPLLNRVAEYFFGALGAPRRRTASTRTAQTHQPSPDALLIRYLLAYIKEGFTTKRSALYSPLTINPIGQARQQLAPTPTTPVVVAKPAQPTPTIFNRSPQNADWCEMQALITTEPNSAKLDKLLQKYTSITRDRYRPYGFKYDESTVPVVAAEHANFDTMKQIIEHMKQHNQPITKAKGSMGNNILHAVTNNNDYYMYENTIELLDKNDITQLLEQKNNKGQTPLHLATKRWDGYNLLKMLHSIPADKRAELLLQPDSDGNTVLHDACANCNMYVLQELMSMLPKEHCKALLTTKNNKNKTPLQEAFSHNLSISTQKLLESLTEKGITDEEISAALTDVNHNYTLKNLTDCVGTYTSGKKLIKEMECKIIEQTVFHASKQKYSEELWHKFVNDVAKNPAHSATQTQSLLNSALKRHSCDKTAAKVLTNAGADKNILQYIIDTAAGRMSFDKALYKTLKNDVAKEAVALMQELAGDKQPISPELATVVTAAVLNKIDDRNYFFENINKELNSIMSPTHVYTLAAAIRNYEPYSEAEALYKPSASNHPALDKDKLTACLDQVKAHYEKTNSEVSAATKQAENLLEYILQHKSSSLSQRLEDLENKGVSPKLINMIKKEAGLTQ